MEIIFLVGLIVFIISVASMILNRSDSNVTKYGHHDSRPDSYYQISQRNKDK